MRLRIRRKVLALLAPLALLPSMAAGGSDMTVAELKDRMTAGTAPVILDVRSPEEFAEGHVPGAVNLPVDQLSLRLGELPGTPADEFVVYCRSGARAQAATEVLTAAGYTGVRALAGHLPAWDAAEAPSQPPEARDADAPQAGPADSR